MCRVVQSAKAYYTVRLERVNLRLAGMRKKRAEDEAKEEEVVVVVEVWRVSKLSIMRASLIVVPFFSGLDAASFSFICIPCIVDASLTCIP